MTLRSAAVGFAFRFALSLVAASAAWLGTPGVSSAQTEDTAPDALVKSVSEDVLNIIRSDKDIQSGDQQKVTRLVQEKILPHFDFMRMTALAVGAPWRKATAEQRSELATQFEALLVRTYSAGLGSYRNQTINYLPTRGNPSDTEVVVRSQVQQSGGQPVNIDYRMEKTPQGWKVFDLIIGGVSLVTTYRDSFGQVVRQSGIDGLIKQLQSKNQQNEQPRG